jgi:hypothetical protein
MYFLVSLLTVLVATLSVDAGNAASWWSLDHSRSFIGKNGKITKAVILTLDLKDSSLRIVSVPFEVKAASAPSEVSLKVFAESISNQPRYRDKEWITVNGAFSSYRADVPLGLLVVDGKVYSTVATERPKSTATKGSEFGKFRWSGILCQSRDGNTWDIIPASRYQPGLCKQAIQAGPVPVEPNFVLGISQDEANRERPYRRTVVCLSQSTIMKIVLVPEQTHLFPLAQWLIKPETAGGPGCRAALNLSGDTSSGIAIKSPGKAISFFGEGSFPLASALVFESR